MESFKSLALLRTFSPSYDAIHSPSVPPPSRDKVSVKVVVTMHSITSGHADGGARRGRESVCSLPLALPPLLPSLPILPFRSPFIYLLPSKPSLSLHFSSSMFRSLLRMKWDPKLPQFCEFLPNGSLVFDCPPDRQPYFTFSTSSPPPFSCLDHCSFLFRRSVFLHSFPIPLFLLFHSHYSLYYPYR